MKTSNLNVTEKVRFSNLTEFAVNEIIVEEAQVGWRVKQIEYVPIREQIAILFTRYEEEG